MKNTKIWVSFCKGSDEWYGESFYLVHREEPTWRKKEQIWDSRNCVDICEEWGASLFPELDTHDPKELLEVEVKQGTVWEPNL